MTATATMLDAANDAIHAGLWVLPLWPLNDDLTCSCGIEPHKGKPGKHPLGRLVPHGVDDATSDPAIARQWWSSWPDAGLAVNLAASGLVLVGPDCERWHTEFRKRGLPATAAALSGDTAPGHYHYFYRRPEGCPVDRINISDQYDIQSSGYAILAPSRHYSGGAYQWLQPLTTVDGLPELPGWALQMLIDHAARAERKTTNEQRDAGDEPPVRLDAEGMRWWTGERFKPHPDGTPNRSDTLFMIGLILVRAGLRHRQTLIDALRDRDAALELNKYGDRRDGGDTEYVRIADKVLADVRDHREWEPGEAGEPSTPQPQAWPDPPSDAAYYGLAGEIVKTLDPATEADPAGVLVSLLAAVGNIIDAGPHWKVNGSLHSLRLFPVLVGPTAKGRKGTTWSTIRPLLKWAAPQWHDTHIVSGLSSGEGLIWAVRDRITKLEPIKDGKTVTGHQEIEVDPGVIDKRLLVVEEEFASTLKLMSREGNILSAVIRQAWDSGDLRTLTKNNPAQATGAHISILSHITQDELLRYLDSTEAANGFANRFLWVCVKRSKELPDGGEVDRDTLIDLAGRLRDVFEFAEHVTLLTRDDEAAELWRQVYGPLSSGGYGLMGAVTSRAEAQVMRLAAINAILDRSTLIRLDHLNAALALWQYIERSAAYIFGDKLGDPIADTILDALRRAGEMTRNELYELFGRNQRRSRIEHALTLLESAGKIRRRKDTATGGRPAELWQAV